MAILKYHAIFSNIFLLQRTAADIIRLPFEHWVTPSWDFQMFSCLFGHISLTINWEHLSVMFLIVAGREEVKQVFNKISNKGQYTKSSLWRHICVIITRTLQITFVVILARFLMVLNFADKELHLYQCSQIAWQYIEPQNHS